MSENDDIRRRQFVVETINALEGLIREQPGVWMFCGRTDTRVDFTATAWLKALPPIGIEKELGIGVNPRLWIWFGVEYLSTYYRFNLFGWVAPATDASLRRKILERLTYGDLGFQPTTAKQVDHKWCRFTRSTPVTQTAKSEPAISDVIAATRKALAELSVRVEKGVAAINEMSLSRPRGSDAIGSAER